MNRQTKWLVALVAVLMVANISLIAFIWLRKDEVRNVERRGDARNYLVNELALDKKQEKSFDSLRADHFEKIEAYKRQLSFVKDRLFSLLSEKDTNRVKQQLVIYLKQKIGDLQANIDLETFNHFYQFRSSLDKQQQQKFDTVIRQVLRNMAPGPEGGEGPPPHRLPQARHLMARLVNSKESLPEKR